VAGLEGILDRTRIPKEMPSPYRTHVPPSTPEREPSPRQTGQIAPGATATPSTGRRWAHGWPASQSDPDPMARRAFALVLGDRRRRHRILAGSGRQRPLTATSASIALADDNAGRVARWDGVGTAAPSRGGA